MMKQFLKLVIMVIMFTSTAFAQQDSSKNEARKMLKRDLNVSEEKAAMLQTAMQLNQDTLVQLLKDRNMPPRERQQQVSLLIGQREAAVKSLLTPQEYKKFQEVISSRMQAKRNHTTTALEQLRQHDQEQLKQISAESNKKP